MKNLCRLCGKEDLLSKDLLLEGNNSIRKMVQEFTQIIVSMDLWSSSCTSLRHKLACNFHAIINIRLC